MRNLKLIYVVLTTVILGSCSQQDNYPKYHLTTIQYVPDSLKSEYSKFITETVRAASQQMNGGDYEDVDETIQQAETTGFNLFSITVVGLRKEIDDNQFNDLHLKPEELTSHEKKILDSLINKK